MRQGEWIEGEEWLSSSNEKFILRMSKKKFRKNTEIELCFLNEKLVLWNLGGSTGSLDRLVMQQNGNLVLYGIGNIPYWSTNTLASGNVFVLQDDGNMVVYKQRARNKSDSDENEAKNEEILWQSLTAQRN